MNFTTKLILYYSLSDFQNSSGKNTVLMNFFSTDKKTNHHNMNKH